MILLCVRISLDPLYWEEIFSYKISVRYSENGKCILDHKEKELVASISVEDKPQLSLTNSMNLPGRTLAVVHVSNDLKPEQSGQLYKIEPNYLLTEEYPNLYIISMTHNVDIHKTEDVPLVVNNFVTDSVDLSKGEIMGFMQNQSLNISEIITETSKEPSPILLEEDNDIEELKEQKRNITLENIEKKFITYPADIDIHRKVELQDAEVDEAQQNAFKELCDEYKDIFSTDSSDIGRTPLIEMEIDTG